MSLICALISNVLAAFMPFIVGKGINKIVGEGKVEFGTLSKIIMILAVVYVISSLFTWIFTVIANIIAFGTVKDIRNEAFEKLVLFHLAILIEIPMEI